MWYMINLCIIHNVRNIEFSIKNKKKRISSNYRVSGVAKILRLVVCLS